MTDVKPEEAEAPPANPNDVHLTINGKPVVAQKGELIIKAADDNGEYIPRFCYHNRMEPVAMCRMCICEVDSGRGPQLVPTCMVTVAEGMKVEPESPASRSPSSATSRAWGLPSARAGCASSRSTACPSSRPAAR